MQSIKGASLTKCLIGVVQMCSHNNPMQNYMKARALVEKCCGEGAQLVCLPECFAYMGTGAKPDEQSSQL